MPSVWKKNNRLRLRNSDEFHYTRLNDKMLHKQEDDDVNMKKKKKDTQIVPSKLLRSWICIVDSLDPEASQYLQLALSSTVKPNKKIEYQSTGQKNLFSITLLHRTVEPHILVIQI